MTKRIIVVMMVVGLCAPMAMAGFSASGDVSPADPATWWSGNAVYIGRTGAGSATIDGGSVAGSDYAYLGEQAGSVGAMTVDGAGSMWDLDGQLKIAYYGDATLGITDGAAVYNGATSSIATFASATGVVTVDGAGSSWASATLYVGSSGVGTLNVTGGGAASSSETQIGGGTLGTGIVTVSGAGSTWSPSRKVYVGRYGDGTLNISDGGLVNATRDVFVALKPGSTGAINFDNGTLTTGGLLCAYDNLAGTGTINANGLVSDVDLVFDATHPLSQTFTLTGPGKNITINLNVLGPGAMGAGYEANGSLHIADGLVVRSSSGFLGYHAGASGAATVTGVGSTWRGGGTFNVGYYGEGTLDIADGATVITQSSRIGDQAGSTGAVTLRGAGSTWTTAELFVGNVGDGTLSVTDGAVLNTETGYITGGLGTTGVVYVSGAGSTWHSSRNLRVGRSGEGTLNITDGGLVEVDGRTHLGRNDGSISTLNFDNGTLTTGALLGSPEDITGTGTINTKGLVSDIDLVIDSTTGLVQTLTFNGPGQNVVVNLDMNGSTAMGAGFRGTGSMYIGDGLAVESDAGYIGYRLGSNGTVTVAGAGTSWTARSFLAGYWGNGALLITDGGSVQSGGAIGSQAGSTGIVTVEGAGSTWDTSDLGVGFYGDATMNITGGGAVSNTTSRIGAYEGSTGAVTVDGTGSTWTTSGKLYVGREGNGTLRITAGGVVSNGLRGYIAYTGGVSGTVLVDGVGSTWTNAEMLYVGRYGSGTLAIINGGLVSVADKLVIDHDTDGDGFINMATGGMLALNGEADDSLAEFLDLIGGSDAIRYWDVGISDWADLTGATYGDDYTLAYLAGGDLMGYTVLTVTTPVPEPATLSLLALGGLAALRRRRRTGW